MNEKLQAMHTIFMAYKQNMHQKDQLPSHIFLSHISVVQSLLPKLGYCLLS